MHYCVIAVIAQWAVVSVVDIADRHTAEQVHDGQVFLPRFLGKGVWPCETSVLLQVGLSVCKCKIGKPLQDIMYVKLLSESSILQHFAS